MNKGSKSKKTRVTRNDIFINRESGQLVRVMMSDKSHKAFGDLQGPITVRPFIQSDDDENVWNLVQDKSQDVEIKERGCLYVRPSCVEIISGDRSKCKDLRVRVEVGHCVAIASFLKEPNDTHIDHAAADDTSSLEVVLGKIPMFANELPLVEQAMVDYGHAIEASPIVHPEIAGRGVEHAHGRAAWYYRSKCEGKVDAMEDLCRRACQKKNTPQALGAKFERRTRDYMRCYRMGVMSKDLEKMRKEIKTHRNMKDYHQKFIESEGTDDDTDVHILTPASVCDGTPPMGEVLATGKYRGETFSLSSATSLGVPFPECDFHFECDWTMNPFSHLAFWV
jgi:hypothetical protein